MKKQNGIALIFLIIIIIILLVLIGISRTGNRTTYLREDVISLMKNGEEYDNYCCEYIKLGEKTIRKIKGNKMVVATDDMTVYIDYDINKQTVLKNTENIAIVSSLSSSKLIKMNKIYYQECIDILNDFENYEYKFITTEKINEFKCIKIALSNESINYEIWVDISSGLVTKISCSNKENSNVTIEYNLKLNSITDEDVKMPDLSKYKVTEL